MNLTTNLWSSCKTSALSRYLMSENNNKLPETVRDAVNQLMSDLCLYDKQQIERTDKTNLSMLHFSTGMHIRNNFRLWDKNRKLFNACHSLSDKEPFDVDDASHVIIDALWERLQKYPPPELKREGAYYW